MNMEIVSKRIFQPLFTSPEETSPEETMINSKSRCSVPVKYLTSDEMLEHYNLQNDLVRSITREESSVI
jgi:hypothetical protein